VRGGKGKSRNPSFENSNRCSKIALWGGGGIGPTKRGARGPKEGKNKLYMRSVGWGVDITTSKNSGVHFKPGGSVRGTKQQKNKKKGATGALVGHRPNRGHGKAVALLAGRGGA